MQFGNQNEAISYTHGGNSRQSEIWQVGNSNYGNQDLGGIYDRAYLEQDGNSNTFYQVTNNQIQQTSAPSYRQIDANGLQYGNGNDGYQLVGKGDNARILTYGNNNESYQYQYGLYPSGQLNNWADIYQNGNGNYARQDQLEDFNIAETTQIGNNNAWTDWQMVMEFKYRNCKTGNVLQTNDGHSH